jgi:mevalonate kinase
LVNINASSSQPAFIEASAPGKVILAGDHAVVHGKPAILAAVDLRCRARLFPRSDGLIEITSAQVAESALTDRDEVVRKAGEARETWAEFRRTNSRELLRQITPGDLDLVEIGIGETILATRLDAREGFILQIDSELPVGAGMGSSATVVAAVVKALDKKYDLRLSKNQLSDIVYETEKKKHGASSGVDVAAAVYGNLLWYRKETEFLRVATPLTFLDDTFFDSITLILTGRPDASTGETVRSVMEKMKQSPGEIQDVFDKIEAITKNILSCLRAKDRAGLLESINHCSDQLERLGVVPPAARSIIDAVREAGGAAKITGAGSLGGDRVGTLLAVHENPAMLHEILSRRNLPFQTVRVSREGAK